MCPAPVSARNYTILGHFFHETIPLEQRSMTPYPPPPQPKANVA
jgi:hypothetical protein